MRPDPLQRSMQDACAPGSRLRSKGRVHRVDHVTARAQRKTASRGELTQPQAAEVELSRNRERIAVSVLRDLDRVRFALFITCHGGSLSLSRRRASASATSGSKSYEPERDGDRCPRTCALARCVAGAFSVCSR